MDMNVKSIHSGIFTAECGEIVIHYSGYDSSAPGGIVVWFEDDYSMLDTIPLAAIKMAAAKIS